MSPLTTKATALNITSFIRSMLPQKRTRSSVTGPFREVGGKLCRDRLQTLDELIPFAVKGSDGTLDGGAVSLNPLCGRADFLRLVTTDHHARFVGATGQIVLASRAL